MVAAVTVIERNARPEFITRDLKRFTERDSQFLKTLPPLGVGVKVGLTAMHAFDQSGRSVAHNVLHTVQKAPGDVIWDAKLTISRRRYTARPERLPR